MAFYYNIFSNYPTEVFKWLFPREGLQAGEGIKEGRKTFLPS
jgi:hypothetical protein